MDFSDILQSINDGLTRMRDRLAFLFRSYRKTSIAVLLILVGGLGWWAYTGFSLQFGRSSAGSIGILPPGSVCTSGGQCWSNKCLKPPLSPFGVCGPTIKQGPGSTCAANSMCSSDNCIKPPASPLGICGVGLPESPTPTPAGAPGASTPPGGSVPAPTSTATAGPCRLWQGSSATNWAAVATPAGRPACTPLPRVDNATFPGYATAVWVESLGQMVTPPDLVPPPVNFADCLIIEDRSSGDPNWGSMTENTVPQIIRDNANAKLFYKAFVINNCPWEAHLLFSVAGSAKAGFELGPAGRPLSISDAEFGKAFTESTPPGRDFPSCWNTGSTTNRPASCGKEISIAYNLNAYTCGSLGVQLVWWHRTSDAGHQDDPRGVGFVSAINYGRDCSGSSAERAPGSGLPGGTAGGPGTTPGVGPHVASTLTVQCGATQNVLRWTLPSNHDTNAVLRNVDSADGVFVNDSALTFSTTTWTDRNIQPGHVYTYRHKAFADRTSNSVTCPTGAVVSPTASPGTSPTISVGASPSSSPGTSPVASATVSGQPQPTFSNGFTPTPTPTPVAGGTPTPSGQPGSVPTGPGDATLLALIISAVVSLAYVSYTHSPTGRRREVQDISKDQGPLDFRS